MARILRIASHRINTTHSYAPPLQRRVKRVAILKSLAEGFKSLLQGIFVFVQYSKHNINN